MQVKRRGNWNGNMTRFFALTALLVASAAGCDDTIPVETCSIHPGDPGYEEIELTCDGLDNDCDGLTDEMIGNDASCTNGIGACAVEGVKKCGLDGAVVCQSLAQGMPSQELCGNGLDDNCDGKTDEGFDVGSQCEAGKGICRLIGKRLCSQDKLGTTCSVEAGPADAYETCGNGLDDNCDGQTDESGCRAPDGRRFKGCGSGPDGSAAAGILLLLAGLVLTARRMARSVA